MPLASCELLHIFPLAGGSGSLQTLRGGSADGSGCELVSFINESGTPDWVSEFRYAMVTRAFFLQAYMVC